jgi:CBS domain-containing protein
MNPQTDRRVPGPRHLQGGRTGQSPTVEKSQLQGDLTASVVMMSPVTTVRPETSITEAAAKLALSGLGALPVLDDDGRVVGLTTEADLARNQLRVTRQRAGTAAHHVAATVDEAMSRTPLIAPSNYALAELVSLMLAAGTSVVPIVDDARFVGVVSMRDVLRIVGSGHSEPQPVPATSDTRSVGHDEYQGLATA